MEKEKIWLSSPHMGGGEIKFVQEAFDTNWISPVGPHIHEFEKEMGAVVNVPHVAALSSGTAAIHLALIILGVQRGDEVICQSFTFSGSCNPIVYLGATPVFVDSETETWNMDPDLLEEAVNQRIKKTGRKPTAIIAVHLYGMPAQMMAIMEVAHRYEIPVIEDAAEALGSVYHGKAVGGLGDIGIFSFNGNKIITTSGGGALVAANEAWVKKARFLATQARDQAPHYEHSEIGYNYRLSNICAGIGRGQLKVLDERVQQRRKIFDRYRQELREVAGLTFPEEPDGSTSNRWLTTVLLDNFETREKVRLAMEAENIECRPLWKPMHRQPVFRDYPSFLNGVSENLFTKGLCFPSGSNMTPQQQARVVACLKGTLSS